MSAEESLLLFDETIEYFNLSKDEQKSEFKKKMASFSGEQVKRRIQLKIERHRERMVGALKPNSKNSKVEHIKKRRDQWNIENNKKVENVKSKVNNVTKKEKLKNDVFNENNNNNFNKKNVKYYSGLEEKKEIKKQKKKFQESGQTIRKSTKKNIKNEKLLNYVDKDDEEKLNENSDIQLEIRESNKKLKDSMKKVTEYSVIKGYSTINKKDRKSDNISRIGNITYERNVLLEKQNKLNPSLLIKKNKNVSDRSKNKNNNNINNVEISNVESLKVLKWHEQRLNEYIEIMNQQNEQIKNLNNLVNNMSKNMNLINFKVEYPDFNTIKSRDIMIRKIQSTWFYYKFKKSFNSIKIQRWYRYVKNVRNVAIEVQEFINDMVNIQKQTSNISKFLSSLDSKKALPIERLKNIKEKLSKQQNVLDI
jgi:hypothetical protein